MVAMLATICVIFQMAGLAFGYNVQTVMIVGLVGCVLWMYHAAKQNDKWLFTTNIVVAMFAAYGIA